MFVMNAFGFCFWFMISIESFCHLVWNTLSGSSVARENSNSSLSKYEK